MDTKPILDQHRRVQAIAKRVLRELAPTIVPEDTEHSIAQRAVELLQTLGVHETWYYECPAFVLLGSRSCLSVSGRDYLPAHETVGLVNLVTVDLSPAIDGVWGDCARSYCIEAGKFVERPSAPEFRRIVQFTNELHQRLPSLVTADVTFEQLHAQVGEVVLDNGYETLDFLGNFGHSVPARLEDRIYIERGNSTLLKDVTCFTFEPHIRQQGGMWGFKQEDIYFLDAEGRLSQL